MKTAFVKNHGAETSPLRGPAGFSERAAAALTFRALIFPKAAKELQYTFSSSQYLKYSLFFQVPQSSK